MNNIQRLENKIVKYATEIGGVRVNNSCDYRQLRKGIRLTHKIQGEGLSYYDWLCCEKVIWHSIRESRKLEQQAQQAQLELTEIEEGDAIWDNL